MESKSDETKQELEEWTPPAEKMETYDEMEMTIIKDGSLTDKLMYYVSRNPSIVIVLAFLVMITLAIKGIQSTPIHLGILILGGIVYIGSLLQRWKDGKSK